MDSIISYLLESAPWVAVVLVAIVLTWFVAIYVSKLDQARKKVQDLPCEKHKDDIKESSSRYEDLQRVVEATNKKVNDLPCERHSEYIKETDLRSKKLQETTESNNDMLVEVSKWIMKLDDDMIDKLARKASPLKMTPVGVILFDQSHGKKTVDDHLDFLISELEEYNPKTAFDVEEKSLSVLLKNIGHEMFNEVKEYLYYSPESIKIKDPFDQQEKDIKLSVQGIIRLMSIYLRDKYFEKYPDIK